MSEAARRVNEVERRRHQDEIAILLALPAAALAESDPERRAEVAKLARSVRVTGVVEVDGLGRPALVRTLNVETNERGVAEFVDGMAPKAGAVSNYDPISRLREEE